MKRYSDSPVPTRIKLAALWTATMFCYVYGDYFGLYVEGKLAAVARGSMGPLGPASAAVLVGVSLMMAVPALLIAAAPFAPLALCRWGNIGFGLLYTAIMALTLPGAEPFYVTLAIIEMALTLWIAVTAWAWPEYRGESH
ncbi:MAG TPA: DUF6326 family protein [Novosphingobium sp.]|nr:DUF6326 family protein [Novosphingobium sp.]HQA17656.1 DUF6326 family protein [Novosphingobium sp.]